MTRALPDVLPEGGWRDDAELSHLCAALGDGNARFVGGAVRDSLLGLPVKDVDIATIHPPETVMERLRAAGIRVVPTGIAHGTVTAVLTSGPVEITTLRHDLSTDGRHATVAFAQDWREDAARRDFTMNALYADPVTGQLFDYFGGRADLAAGQVSFIGDARARIDEDHLRILRYFRFLARFGQADGASDDYRACMEKAPTLIALSRERIADEMMKLLATVNPVAALRLMVEGDILSQIVPEATRDGVDRVAALIGRESEMNEAPDGLLRLLALLPADAHIADHVAARLKFSNKTRRRIAKALGETVAGDGRALAYRLGTRGALDRIALGRALTPQDAAALRFWQAPRLPVSGGDLIKRGMTAGPEVAQMLKTLEDAWIAAQYPDREYTLKLTEKLLEQF